MPAYDYACRACGAHVELTHRISDPPVTTCPACKAETLERLVSPSSFALRGSGWYADGYGSKGGSATSESKPNPGPTDAPAAAPKPEAPAKSDGGSTS